MGNKKLQQLYRAQFQVDTQPMAKVVEWLRTGKTAEARKWLDERVRSAPKDSGAWDLLGDLQSQELDREGAVESYAQALMNRPGDLKLLRKLARVLLESSQLPEAIQVFKTITVLNPSDAEAQLWLAKTHFRLNPAQGEEEVLRAIELSPDSVDAWKIYAQILDKNLRVEESLSALSNAISLGPERVDLRTLQLRLHQNGGQIAQAQRIFDEFPGSLRADGCIRMVDAMIHDMMPSTVEEITASRARQHERLIGIERDHPPLHDPVTAIGMTNFKLTYHGLPELELMQQTTRTVLACDPSLGFVNPAMATRPAPGQKIKVGFLSPHLADHSLGRVLNRFLKELDRSRFEVFHVDLSERFIKDENRIKDYSDHTLVVSKDLTEARQQISALGLHIAFFGEVILNPLTDFLGYSRFAPVQCMTWGHPATSGRPSIDYWISSEAWDPAGNERFYSERLIRLGNLPFISARPKFADSMSTRDDIGLPEGRIFACPQSLFKLHPDFDRILQKILDQDTEGHIVLSAGFEPRWVKQLTDRLGPKLGTNSKRVIFLPHLNSEGFGVLLRNSNVLLDPIYFGGGLSSLDALSAGRPIVTWPIDQLRSRMTAGFYHQMGYTDLIVHSEDEYVAKAIRIANDPVVAEAASGRILATVQHLFDNIEPCRQLERFFEAAVAGDVGDGCFH